MVEVVKVVEELVAAAEVIKEVAEEEEEEEKIEAEIKQEEEVIAEVKEAIDSNYMIERIIVAIKASKQIQHRQEIEYMKYRIHYSNNSDVEGYFKCQKPEEFVHEVTGTWQERKLILEQISARSIIVQLKKKKTVLNIGTQVIGKQELPMPTLSRLTPHE